MAAHRYWRARFESPQALALSEFQLLAGTTRVDAPATLSSNVAPATGALANLKDDDTATQAAWPLARVVVLQWDFGGSPVDVSDIRLGSTLSRSGFPTLVFLDWSDDGSSWSISDAFGGIVWPGFLAKTASEQLGNFLHAVPMSPQTGGGAPPLISSSPTVLLVDNNGLFVATKNPSAGVVLQVEFGRASIAAGGLGMYAGFTTRRAIDTHRANSTSLVNSAQSWIYDMNGQKRNNASGVAYGATWTTGDVIGATFNTSTGAITFYKNGVSQGVAYTVVAADFPDLVPFILAAGSSGQASGANAFLRTRGFTSAVAGAIAWEDRTRITSSIPVASAAPALLGKVATQSAWGVAFVKALKMPYRLARDFRDPMLGTGRGRVKGTTKDKGTPNVPVAERVRLYREIDGALIQEKISTPGTGAYSFDYVDELQTYTVISYDHDKNFRAVIADGLTLAGGGVEYIGDTPVVAPVALRVRDVSPLVLSASGTVINAYVPTCQAGDLLVAVVMTRAALSTPAGWTLVSGSGMATGSGITQQSLVYTRVAISSEPASYAFTQVTTDRMNAQILALASPLGTPAFNVEAHSVKSNTTDSFIPLPSPTPVSPGTKNQLAVGVSSSINAYPDALTVFPSDWTNYVRPSSPTTDNRLALAFKRLNGDAISGNAACNGASGNALTANVLIFTDP